MMLPERAAVFRPVASRKTAVLLRAEAPLPDSWERLMDFKNIATIVVVSGLTFVAIDAYKAKKR